MLSKCIWEKICLYIFISIYEWAFVDTYTHIYTILVDINKQKKKMFFFSSVG